YRTHGDEAIALYRATMQDGTVPDSDSFFDHERMAVRDMQETAVLNVAVVADGDAIDVASHHAVEPDARAFADLYTPDHHGRGSDEDAVVQRRLIVFKRQYHTRSVWSLKRRLLNYSITPVHKRAIPRLSRSQDVKI